MRIALDAMGGDYAPAEIVKGAVDAAKNLSSVSSIILCGDRSRIEDELSGYEDVPGALTVHHASEVIGMDEAPAQAVRRKKDSSIGRAADLVKEGMADAMVSAGNTGAVVVAATLKLRTLDKVERPAIGAVLPTLGRPFVLIDAGANIDCDARLLSRFAAMGAAYSKIILDSSDPVVGLMSIGGEQTKGNEVTKRTFEILTDAPLNFRGNIEGHDLFRGETDVVVCDGFVGNIVLKTSESTSYAIGQWMKQEFKRTPIRLLGAALLGGALKRMKVRMNPESYGGAPLLGVRGVCIITHGASSRHAIYHAIRVACESVHQHLNEVISTEIERMEGVS